MAEKRILAFGALFLVDLVLSLVMLATDKNLQTKFGAVAPYYWHWYGVLGMAILDLVVGAVLIAAAFPGLGSRLSARARRAGIGAALLWAIVAIGAMVGIVTAYSQVGFSSESQFEQYLFDPTPYSGALSYIPWLYDALLLGYLVTAIVGVLALLNRPPSVASAA